MTENVNRLIKARFADHVGVSKAQVTKWDKANRLVMIGKYVLVNESLELLRETGALSGFANSVHAENKRIEDAVVDEAGYEDLKSNVSSTQLDLGTKDAKKLFENARALREKAEALQSVAEHEKFIGDLVSKDIVAKIMFERARACRDALTTSARRMSPLIAGKDDVAEIEALLTEEFRSLLKQFAKMPLLNE